MKEYGASEQAKITDAGGSWVSSRTAVKLQMNLQREGSVKQLSRFEVVEQSRMLLDELFNIQRRTLLVFKRVLQACVG